MAKSNGTRARRSRGEGAITELPDGRFRGAVWLTRPDGATQRKYVRGRTRAEVTRKFEAIRTDAEAGYPDGTTSGAYLAEWIAAVKGRNLRPTTVAQYARHVSSYWTPTIGKVELS